MDFLTPLARKLLLIWLFLLLWIPVAALWRGGRDYWKVQHGDVALVLNHPFYRGDKADRKLKSFLDHKKARVRSEAAELLIDRGYVPSTPEERISFALATGDFRYAPLQIDEVLDQLTLKASEGYEFWIFTFGQDANIDLRFQKFYRAYTLQDLGTNYYRLPVEACQPHNGYFTSLRNGIGLGDREWLEGCVKDQSLKLQSREWAVDQLGRLRSYESIPVLLETLQEEVFLNKTGMRSTYTNPFNVFQWIQDDRVLPFLLNSISQEFPHDYNTASEAIDARWDSPVLVRAILERYLKSNPADEKFNYTASALNFRNFSWEYKKTDLKPVQFPPPRKPRSPSSRDSTRAVTDQEIKQLSAQIQEILTPVPGQQEMNFRDLDDLDLYRKILPGDNPGLLPLVRAFNLRKHFSGRNPSRTYSYSSFIGLEYLGEMKDTNSLPRLLSCLRSQASAYRGLEALGDPGVIPQLKTLLPEVIWFKHAMRTLEVLGWEPETEEERAFQLIYHQDKQTLEENKALINKVLREQINSTEVRRREFAAYMTVGLGLEDLVPDLVEYLGVDGDGRIANYMFHSGQPELVNAAENWREHAPPGLRIPNRVDAGWGNWFN